ncbi:hypothetical protein QJS04_geneDACA001635 [Acorus gramineus]|uniref:Uncharacterized protein n=1 Tax=Acorus gramineus TaxID=55184 RepID=A0AAV9BI68_ACOGR|nr:hypothetical protein QJS04_geneDACA001635 [Acorus gramineus]
MSLGTLSQTQEYVKSNISPCHCVNEDMRATFKDYRDPTFVPTRQLGIHADPLSSHDQFCPFHFINSFVDLHLGTLDSPLRYDYAINPLPFDL